jgi:hypothetical protein
MHALSPLQLSYTTADIAAALQQCMSTRLMEMSKIFPWMGNMTKKAMFHSACDENGHMLRPAIRALPSHKSIT